LCAGKAGQDDESGVTNNSKSDTYEVDLVVGEEGLGLLVVDAGVDDDVLALLPVDGRRNAVLVAELDRVDCAEDLVLGSDNYYEHWDGRSRYAQSCGPRRRGTKW
jgi:hypothetical protein